MLRDGNRTKAPSKGIREFEPGIQQELKKHPIPSRPCAARNVWRFRCLRSRYPWDSICRLGAASFSQMEWGTLTIFGEVFTPPFLRPAPESTAFAEVATVRPKHMKNNSVASYMCIHTLL